MSYSYNQRKKNIKRYLKSDWILINEYPRFIKINGVWKIKNESEPMSLSWANSLYGEKYGISIDHI